MINAVNPDVVLLQEWYRTRHNFILGLHEHYYFQQDGELLIASKFPIMTGRITATPRGSPSAAGRSL